MAATEAFGVTVKADFRDFEKALLRAQNQTDAKLAAVEKRFTAANQNVRRQTGGLASAARSGLNELSSAVTSAGGGLPGLSAGMSGLGVAGAAAAVGVGALLAALRGVQDASKFAADLTDAADRIGIGVEALQELRYAADETGVPLASLDSALEALNGTLGAFKTGIGGGRVKPVFEALGLTPADLAQVHTANDLLPILADRLGKISDRATQVQLARKLGIEPLLPLLRQGSDGLNRMAREGRDLGLVLSGDVVAGLDETDRALERNKQQIDSNVRAMQAVLAPFFVWVSNMAAKAARALADLLSVSESERLQNAIDLRARIERGQRANGGRPLDARTQGIYDRAGREAQAIVSARATRATTPANAAQPPIPDFVPGGGGGARTVSRGAARSSAQDTGRRFDDQLAAAARDTLSAQGQLATTTKQRASIAMMMLDLERQTRRVELDRQVTDGQLSAAQRDQLLAAEQGAWVAREANIAAMVDNEQLARARDQLLEALRQDAATQEAARRTYEAAKEGFRNDFVQGLRAALDGELKGFFESLADRFTDRLLANLSDQAFDLIFSGSGKGSGDVLGSIGKIGASLFNALPKFANGGSFRVGGSGGVDSQVRMIRATPNETVSVTKPGQFAGVGRPISFDLRGAVMTPDLLRQMERMAVASGGQAFQGARQTVPADLARRERFALGRR